MLGSILSMKTNNVIQGVTITCHTIPSCLCIQDEHVYFIMLLSNVYLYVVFYYNSVKYICYIFVFAYYYIVYM